METVRSRMESGVLFRDRHGAQVQGKLVHATAESVVFEVYSPYCAAHAGDTLAGFTFVRGGRPVCAGSALVTGVLSTGLTSVVAATPVGLCPAAEAPSDPLPAPAGGRLTNGADGPLLPDDGDDESAAPLVPAYQIAVSNVRAFLGRLNQWVAPADLASSVPSLAGVSHLPPGRHSVEELAAAVRAKLRDLFGRLEDARREVPIERLPAHGALIQRELHPLTMCAPLVHRTYTKPLGYAGDYEMVNMILRNRLEGPSTYAKAVNSFFLDLDVARGHRNRIDKLTDTLGQQAARVVARGRPLRVLNIGCGPAEEVCRFVRRNVLSAAAEFTLLDFNRETLDYARAQVDSAMQDAGRQPAVEYVQKSVNDLLKDAVRSRSSTSLIEPRYDLVYCAGLFDYLSDKVCTRLIEMMYQWVLPRGAVVVTNVHPRHTAHAILDDLVEWHLTLRTEAEVLALAPRGLGEASVETEPLGTNVFLEIRKPVEVPDDVGPSHSRTDRQPCGAAR